MFLRQRAGIGAFLQPHAEYADPGELRYLPEAPRGNWTYAADVAHAGVSLVGWPTLRVGKTQIADFHLGVGQGFVAQDRQLLSAGCQTDILFHLRKALEDRRGAG